MSKSVYIYIIVTSITLLLTAPCSNDTISHRAMIRAAARFARAAPFRRAVTRAVISLSAVSAPSVAPRVASVSVPIAGFTSVPIVTAASASMTATPHAVTVSGPSATTSQGSAGSGSSRSATTQVRPEVAAVLSDAAGAMPGPVLPEMLPFDGLSFSPHRTFLPAYYIS